MAHEYDNTPLNVKRCLMCTCPDCPGECEDIKRLDAMYEGKFNRRIYTYKTYKGTAEELAQRFGVSVFTIYNHDYRMRKARAGREQQNPDV